MGNILLSVLFGAIVLSIVIPVIWALVWLGGVAVFFIIMGLILCWGVGELASICLDINRS